MKTLAAVALILAALMSSASAQTASDFEFGAIEGGKHALDKWRGRVLLVVNTASFCGYTPQYEGLQKLWEKYEGAGLVVLGVPSNDFGAQEPKAETEIQAFCKGAYNVTFPLTTKEVVSGEGAHPFYRWARTALGDKGTPRWNFHKVLIGRDGKPLAGYGSSVTPQSATLVYAIESALAAKP